MEKTAVEWLVEQIKQNVHNSFEEFESLIEQAKEMEKQQIIDGYHINPLESKWKNIGIDYYNETFKTK